MTKAVSVKCRKGQQATRLKEKKENTGDKQGEGDFRRDVFKRGGTQPSIPLERSS